MTGISHKLAQRYLRAAADGLIRDNQRVLLDAHLRECDSCRAEADELNALEARLKKNFQARWDANDGPSTNVIANIHSRSRRIIMTNRINIGLKTLAGIAALLVLGLIFSSVIRQLQKSSTNISAPISTTQQAIGTDKSNGGLLAFVSEKSGDPEIYTMYADGSNLTNLTNDPAYDGKPFWSPNGKRIAFESDRSGLPQIYLMDANGSNVTQVTDDEAAHLLPYNIDGRTDSWSPDGSKLLFLQQNPGDGMWTLGSININGENKISIITGKIQFNGISWSPDGKHIGFILNDSQSTDENDDIVPEIYIANTDGSVPWAATESLQQNEQFSDTGYTWSPDGQAITFKTFLQKTDPQWTIYEVRLDDHSAIEKYSTESFSLIKWQDGVAVTLDSNGAFNWLNMDRISGVLDPYENCDIPFAGSYINQSSGGNWAIASYCPNGDHWFYWANSDGTEIKQLFDSPISAKEDSFTDEIIWSPDDTFVVFVFNLASSVTNDMYILNVEKSLSNPTIQPLKIESSYSPSWQPRSDNNVVENIPTPAPQQFPSIGTDKSNGEWIAFIGGKVIPDSTDPTALTTTSDVYMIHPDGTGLMNLTNNEDHSGPGYSNLQWSPNGEIIAFLQYFDHTKIMGANQNGSYVITDINIDDSFSSNPYSWSPNSKQITFIDNRSGNYDIYTVYADGRNDPQLTQLTNDPGQDIGFVWSPDGSRIAYQRLDGDKLSVYIMNADGSNQRKVAQGVGKVNLRWSQDGMSIYASTKTENDWLDCETCVHKPGIYHIYLDGSVQVHQIHYEQDASKVDGWYLYDTPQNMLYFMRIHHSAFLNFRGTWLQADDNSVRELGDMDPHQTCKTTTGNILSEHISPNERFSIITDACAGGFDLYLADRQASNPEKKLIHLLRLPLSTYGQGGDDAYLPISWSPDGRWLIYDNGNGSIYLLNIEKVLQDPTTTPTPLTNITDILQSLGEFEWQPRP